MGAAQALKDSSLVGLELEDMSYTPRELHTYRGDNFRSDLESVDPCVGPNAFECLEQRAFSLALKGQRRAGIRERK
jgi:hypothetical protein